jgi:cellulose synthase/poly-beta-1,6-N-acetylglucosamine synthase-like glycosyltransferase
LDLQLLRGLKKLEEKTPPSPQEEFPDITVLIAARNEEHNLPRVLEALLAQKYPADKYHVVVVNDRSTDATESLLRIYAERFPGRIDFVSISTLPAGWAPKKHALLRGLEHARGEWIAVTDADSEMGPEWLSALSREFGADVGMVLGMTTYDDHRDRAHRPRTASEDARALEFVSFGVTSAALLGLGFPVIANANNLAYRRRAFNEAGAFERHGHVVSGDDDFTLQEIHATGDWKVRTCITPGALMRTEAPATWGPFWEQRKRWGSKCFHYRPAQVIFLLAVFAFYLSIPTLLIAGFWNVRWALWGLMGFGVKTAADFLVMARGLRLFGLSPLLRAFPLTALLHIPLILGAVTAGMLRGFTWKGQKLGTQV